MTSVIVRSFGINLKLLWYFRLYNPEKSTSLYKVQACVMYIVLVWSVPCLGIINLFMKDNFDMERVNYDAAVLAETACFITKYLPLIRNPERIRNCINYFNYLSSSKKLNYKQKNIQKECISICRKTTFIYLSTIIGAFINLSVRPLFWKGYQLPVDMWFPFDITSNTYIFILIYFFIMTSVFYVAIVTSTLDPLIGGLACLVTGELKILQDKLQNLDIYVDEILENSNLDKNKIIFKEIQKCVDHHNEIISFSKKFEECFSLSIFSQIIAGVIVICFSSLQITRLQTTDITTVFQMGSYIAIMIAQMYFYCNYGSTVYEESDNITKAIYMSNWYSYDIKSKKALGILMVNSQKPIKITSGKVIVLSLETFAATLKRTYSLLAVLKNYYQ